MFFKTIILKHFEQFLPEFFLIEMIIILLLFSIFLTRKDFFNQKFNYLLNFVRRMLFKYFLNYKFNIDKKDGIFDYNFNIEYFFIKIVTLNYIIIILLFVIKYLIIFSNNHFDIYSYTIFNNSLIIDNSTQFIKILLIFFTILCFMSQKSYMIDQKLFYFEIYILLLISLLGSMLLVSSFNFIILYLAVELQSLSFYILTASQKSKLSTEAALKYFILGSISSGFILFGSSLIYLAFSSLDFGIISVLLKNLSIEQHSYIISTSSHGLFLIFIGLLFKLGSSPFHFWIPDVYEGSPNNITLFFSVVPKISYIYILIRLHFNIFTSFFFLFENLFYFCACLSIFFGSIMGLQQKKIKRLLAYSSIGHVGFILIGFTSNSIESIAYIFLYIIIYAISNVNLWVLYLALKVKDKPIKYLTDMSGLWSYNPLFSFLIILNIFSMAGIPPLAGFFGKYYILLNAIKYKYYGLVVFSIFFNILSLFYYLKIVKVICFEKINKKSFLLEDINSSILFIVVINSFFLVTFFVFADNFILYLNNMSFLFIL